MAEELNAEGIISQLDARALELLVEAYTEYQWQCECELRNAQQCHD
nr:hypothetical protein [Escherichia coli]